MITSISASLDSFLGMLPWAIAWLALGAVLYFLANSNPIGQRELKSYFQSSIAYVCMVIFVLAVMALTFIFGFIIERGEAELSNAFFVFHPWVYIIVAPAVGMRLWSSEHRMGTFELLATFPMHSWKIGVWKFIAASLVLYSALTMTFPIVITINFLGNPDNGVIFAGYLGSFLLALSFLAISTAVSAITRSQSVSLLVSVLICLGQALAGYDPLVNWIKGMGAFGNILRWIPHVSVLTHFRSFSKGLIDTSDLAFYLMFIIIGLAVTQFVLQTRRS